MDSQFPWRKLTAGTLVVLLVVLTGLYVFRLPLAESLIAAFLESRAIPGSAKVLELGPGGIQLADVRLGELTAQSIGVRWRWSPQGGLSVTHLAVVAPDLSIDLTGGPRPFSELTHAFAGPTGETSATPGFELPTVTVEGGRGRLTTTAGVVNLAYELHTTTEGPLARTYQATLAADGPAVTATADLRIDWRDGRLRASAISFKVEDSADGSRVTGRSGLGWQADQLEADIEFAGTLSDDLPRRLGLAPGALSGRAGGMIEGTLSWILPQETLVPATGPDRSTLRFRVEGSGLAWTDVASGGQIDWSGEATYERDRDLLELRPAAPLRLAAAFPGWQRRFPALADIVAPNASDSVSGALETDVLRIRPAAGIASMDDARLEVVSGGGDSVRTRGPVEIKLGPEPTLTTRLEATLAFPASLRNVVEFTGTTAMALSGSPDDFTLTVDGPSAVALTPARASLWEPLAWLDRKRITIAAVARTPEGPPCLSVRSQAGDITASLDCRLTANSPDLGSVEIQAAGETRQATDGPLDLGLEALALRGRNLRTPYGTLDRVVADGKFSYQGGSLDAEFTANADVRHLDVEGTRADRGRVTLVGTLSGAPDDLRLALKPSRVQANALTLPAPDSLRVTPVAIALSGADISFVKGRVSGEARLSAAPASLEIGDITVNLGAAELTLSSTPAGYPAALFNVGHAEALAYGLGAYDIRLAARQTGTDRYHADLQQASVRDLTLPQRFPASKWTGRLSAEGARLTGQVEGRPDTAPQASLSITGRYDTEADTGHAEFGLDGIRFRPGLQPRAFWPGAAVLDKVAGNLVFAGAADFNSTGIVSSEGRFMLDLDSFESDGTLVAGLSLPLTLSSLWPVRSPPGQHLTIDRIGDGTGASAIDVEFRLAEGQDGTPILEISQGSLETLGGRIRIPPTRLDPARDVQSLVLEADHLDLLSVLSLITREGVDAEGRLSGHFPIRLEGENLVIDGAVLESEAPGRLVFSSSAASQTLKPGGDHMTLLLKALENFHYERLSLSVDKAAAGDAHLRLSLLGHNPDVLEGYPFAINIDLRTDVAPFLSVLQQGNDMVDEVIKRIWRP